MRSTATTTLRPLWVSRCSKQRGKQVLACSILPTGRHTPSSSHSRKRSASFHRARCTRTIPLVASFCIGSLHLVRPRPVKPDKISFITSSGITQFSFFPAALRDWKEGPPFTFLGPASLVSLQQERPIQMVWPLNHLMPAVMFEENRRGG